MKRATEYGHRAFYYSRLLPALVLLGAGAGFFSGSLRSQDCTNCTRGELEPGGTFHNTLSMDDDCRHTGGAGPPYDIIRYEQNEAACVTFTTTSSCNTMLEILDEGSCLSFIQNNDCPSWEAEGLDNERNSCLSLRLCPGIYYLCVYTMSPCEGWPDTRSWDYSIRVSQCREEPEIPANDNCDDAIGLVMNTSVTGTTLQAACDDAPACSSAAHSGMVWYRFTGTGSEVEIDVCSLSTEIQAEISVYSGGCSDLACVDGERIKCPRDRESVIIGTEAGLPYHLAVYGSGEPEVDSWLGEFELTINGTPLAGSIKPGDFNADSSLDISDALSLLGFLFSGTERIPCPDQDGLFTHASMEVADFNGDARLDISDAVSALGWLFLGAPAHHLGFECRPIEGCSGQNSCSSP